jgi:sensor domain CHASE-containing protein
MTLDMGTLFGFTMVVIALVGVYAGVRNLMDQKDRASEDRLNAQTDKLFKKLDEQKDAIGTVCTTQAVLVSSVQKIDGRVEKLENTVFIPNPAIERRNRE